MSYNHSVLFRIPAALLLLLLLTAATPSRASVRWDQNTARIFTLVMQLKLDDAQNQARRQKNNNPGNLAYDYIIRYAGFLDILINDRFKEYDRFLDSCNSLIEHLKDESTDNPYRNYFITDLYLQKAWIQVLDESWFSAAYNLSKARNYILENQQLHPGFLPDNKALGLMNIALGSIPENYAWITSLLGLKGSVNKGLKQLRQLADTALAKPRYHWLATEAAVSYAFAVRQSRQKRLPPSLLERILKANNSQYNQLLTYTLASYYHSTGQNDAVITLLEKCTPKAGFQRFYYLDYMLGSARLYAGDATAEDAFFRYLNSYPGRDYRKAARLRLTWFYTINNRHHKAIQQLQKIKTDGRDFFDSDKSALKAAGKGQLPHPALLQARLYFDGGYYPLCEKSLKTITPDTLKTKAEKTEYLYRLGRLYDEWGQPSKAIPYYRQTIVEGRSLPRYFAANAALHLGYIYENQGDNIKAKEYFKEVIQMDFTEYHNSITREAKAALNRLEE